MKRINILYWLILPAVAYLCYSLLQNFKHNVSDFMGYTENRETQINLDFGAVVNKIYVSEGQNVKKGEILLEMEKKSFDKEIENLDQSVAILNNKNRIDNAEILTSIEKVNADKTQRVAQLKNEIAIEEAKLSYNKSLLSSSTTVSQNNIIHPIQEKIASLRKEIETTEQSTRSIIASYNDLLKKMKSTEVEAKTYQTNKLYVLQEKNKLKIIAPYDGIVGNINVKTSEYVQGYNTMMSFYEQSPSSAVGYVHESQSLKVNIGDSVSIKSVMHPTKIIKGVVYSKGYRIIEIPERLRKIPEYKTYGMEVFIKIPNSNSFLQKENVKLSIVN